MDNSLSGFAPINGAKIYYETAGSGTPFVMLHAGVANSRQWTNEFAHFQGNYRVLRYDMRGYGQSLPVEGEYSHMQDLIALLEYLEVNEPAILMGCSMGGGLAMDFALDHPSRAKALIMVDSGPSGLKLDVPSHPKAAELEKADDDDDLDLTAELETQIWFDGMDRTPSQVNQAMRKLVYQMNRQALELESRQLGTRLPNAPTPAAGRLSDLKLPVLIIVGVHDIPYMQAAADYMLQKLPQARMASIEDAAHLPNLEHPEEFRQIVASFLREKVPADLEKQLLDLEAQFWKGDADFYQRNLTGDSLMVFAEPVGTLTKDRTVQTIAAGPRWAEVQFREVRVVRLTDDVVIITYKASARREGEDSDYSALASSVYVSRDGSWKLAFHQQTPSGEV